MSKIRKENILSIFGILFLGTVTFGSQLHIHCDWAIAYDTISEIYEESDLVIRGTIRDSFQLFSLDPKKISRIKTTQFIGVKSIIKGECAPSIYINQEGGRYHLFKVTELDDYPLYRMGEEYILFLRKIGDNKYISLGSPQGSYKVIDGKVYSVLEIVNMVGDPELSTNGTEVNLFMDLIVQD